MDRQAPIGPNTGANRAQAQGRSAESRTAEDPSAARNPNAEALENPGKIISSEKISQISQPMHRPSARNDEPRDLKEIQEKAAANNIFNGLKSLVRGASKWIAIGCTGISALLHMTLGKWFSLPFFALTAAPTALMSYMIPKNTGNLNTSKFSDVMRVFDKILGDSLGTMPKPDLILSEASEIKKSCKGVLANIKKYTLEQKRELFDKAYELYSLTESFLLDGFTKSNEMIQDVKKQVVPLLQVLDQSIVEDKVKAQSQG